MNKSRNQSLLDFLDCLQKEYLVACLRRNIATTKKDKSYFDYVKTGKQKKINDIANRNYLDTIFTAPELLEEYRKKVHPPFGFPDFQYRDEDDQFKNFERDFYNYYATDSHVRFKSLDNEVLLGTVIIANFEDKGVAIMTKDSSVHVIGKYSVSRIL